MTYHEQRDVFVDGQRMGRTNRRIEIGRGTYTVNLGDPRDYRPNWRRVKIKGTFPDDPLIVTFERLGEEEA